MSGSLTASPDERLVPSGKSAGTTTAPTVNGSNIKAQAGGGVVRGASMLMNRMLRKLPGAAGANRERAYEIQYVATDMLKRWIKWGTSAASGTKNAPATIENLISFVAQTYGGNNRGGVSTGFLLTSLADAGLDVQDLLDRHQSGLTGSTSTSARPTGAAAPSPAAPASSATPAPPAGATTASAPASSAPTAADTPALTATPRSKKAQKRDKERAQRKAQSAAFKNSIQGIRDAVTNRDEAAMRRAFAAMIKTATSETDPNRRQQAIYSSLNFLRRMLGMDNVTTAMPSFPQMATNAMRVMAQHAERFDDEPETDIQTASDTDESLSAVRDLLASQSAPQDIANAIQKTLTLAKAEGPQTLNRARKHLMGLLKFPEVRRNYPALTRMVMPMLKRHQATEAMLLIAQALTEACIEDGASILLEADADIVLKRNQLMWVFLRLSEKLIRHGIVNLNYGDAKQSSSSSGMGIGGGGGGDFGGGDRMPMPGPDPKPAKTDDREKNRVLQRAYAQLGGAEAYVGKGDLDTLIGYARRATDPAQLQSMMATIKNESDVRAITSDPIKAIFIIAKATA